MGTSVTFDARPGGAYRWEIVSRAIRRIGEFVEARPTAAARAHLGLGAGRGRHRARCRPGRRRSRSSSSRRVRAHACTFTHRDLPSAESAARHAERLGSLPGAPRRRGVRRRPGRGSLAQRRDVTRADARRQPIRPAFERPERSSHHGISRRPLRGDGQGHREAQVVLRRLVRLADAGLQRARHAGVRDGREGGRRHRGRHRPGARRRQRPRHLLRRGPRPAGDARQGGRPRRHAS